MKNGMGVREYGSEGVENRLSANLCWLPPPYSHTPTPPYLIIRS